MQIRATPHAMMALATIAAAIPAPGRQTEPAEVAVRGGGGEKGGRVGADREESGDPRIEEPGEPPLDVEAQGEHRVDASHREQEHRVEEDAVELVHTEFRLCSPFRTPFPGTARSAAR